MGGDQFEPIRSIGPVAFEPVGNVDQRSLRCVHLENVVRTGFGCATKQTYTQGTDEYTRREIVYLTRQKNKNKKQVSIVKRGERTSFRLQFGHDSNKPC